MIRFDFNGLASSFKGGRQYIHGSDIIEEIETIFKNDNGLITEITFLEPLQTIGRIVLTPTLDKREAKATGILTLEKRFTHFRVEETNNVLNDERPYDEDAIPVEKISETEYAVTITKRTTMEHVLCGVKYASMDINPNQSGWWFARMRDKNIPVPDISTVDSIMISQRRNVAGKMIQCAVDINNTPFAVIEFVGKK